MDLIWYAKNDPENIHSLGTTYWEEDVEDLKEEIAYEGADWPLIKEGVVLLDSSEATGLLSTIEEDLI
jgi:hypothetical protein